MPGLSWVRPSSTFAPRHRESPVPVQRSRRGEKKKKNIEAEKASANIPQLSRSSFFPPLSFLTKSSPRWPSPSVTPVSLLSPLSLTHCPLCFSYSPCACLLHVPILPLSRPRHPLVSPHPSSWRTMRTRADDRNHRCGGFVQWLETERWSEGKQKWRRSIFPLHMDRIMNAWAIRGRK